MKMFNISTILVAIASFAAAAPTGQISADSMESNATVLLTAQSPTLVDIDQSSPSLLSPRGPPLLGGGKLGPANNQCRFNVLVLWYHYRIRLPNPVPPNKCEDLKDHIPAVTKYKCHPDGFGGAWLKFDTWLFTRPKRIEKALNEVLDWDMKCTWMHKPN